MNKAPQPLSLFRPFLPALYQLPASFPLTTCHMLPGCVFVCLCFTSPVNPPVEIESKCKKERILGFFGHLPPPVTQRPRACTNVVLG